MNIEDSPTLGVFPDDLWTTASAEFYAQIKAGEKQALSTATNEFTMPTKEKQQLSVFNFNGQALTVLDDGNQPWFIANEVCNALGIANNRDAVGRLDEDEKGVGRTDTLGGKQNVLTINESGLYSLTLTSNKPEAKVFKKWITAEVLPAIRKTGSYSVKPQPSPQDIFVKNHKAACLLFTDRNKRLLYANNRTLEQTGVNIMEQAGIEAPQENYALNNLLNKTIDDRTVQQLLDSIHYQRLDHANTRLILLGMGIKLSKGVIYIANRCPLVDDFKALKSAYSSVPNCAVYFSDIRTTARATAITLY